MVLKKNYNKFVANNAEFKVKQKDLLKPSEVELHILSEELELKDLRLRIEEDLKVLVENGTKLYIEIYDGEPQYEDLVKFIGIADQIIACEDFVSSDMIEAWEVFRSLVENFRKTFK